MAQSHMPTSRQSNQPVVSPYAAQSHSRGAGSGLRSFSKHSLKVTAPLLIIGIFAVVAGLNLTSNTAPLNGSKAATTQVTLNHDSSPAATPDTTSSGGASLNATVGSATNGNSTTTQVTVNGQNVPVPANGTVQKTVTSPDGSTNSFSVTTNSQGSATNSSFSSTNMSISNSSSSFDSSSGTGYTIVNGVPYFY